MHELDPSYLGMPTDPQQGRDVARWRKCERERLIAARFAMPADERLEHAARIANDLDAFVAITPETVVSVYWPVRGEPDLRPWMTALCQKGVRIALPAVAAGYQLGYGGGFLDRTLAHLRPRPLAIGVGYPIGLISTIYPQAHDIPMDWIVTGIGSLMQRPGL